MVNDYEIERLLFKIVEKPKNISLTKIINVFHDYYRINIYTETEDEGLTKRKISQSYMTIYRDNKLSIVPNNDKPKL